MLYLMNRVYLAQRTQFHLHSKCFSRTLGRNKRLEITPYFKEICKERFMTFYGFCFFSSFFFLSYEKVKWWQMKPDPFIHLKETAGVIACKWKPSFLSTCSQATKSLQSTNPLIFHDQSDHSSCTVRYCTTAQLQTHELSQSGFYALF